MGEAAAGLYSFTLAPTLVCFFLAFNVFDSDHRHMLSRPEPKSFFIPSRPSSSFAEWGGGGGGWGGENSGWELRRTGKALAPFAQNTLLFYSEGGRFPIGGTIRNVKTRRKKRDSVYARFLI